jgi:hypothetical protein
MAHTELVRSYVERNIVDPARREGRLEFSVVAGDVHKALGFSNRVPLVCQALKSKLLLSKNGLELKSATGPPSGLSTTMVFTYRFASAPANAKPTKSGLRTLAGIGKDVWKRWGGGEAFLKQERLQFKSKQRV